MSQGRKREPERSLFLVASEIYWHVPGDHFYERLDALLDLEFVRELTLPLHKAGVRPSLDPVVFFKYMFIGFFENIIYDTELEYRLPDSLTLRRFLGYSLDERTPDESTLRKTRQRMPEETFDQVFRKVLDQYQAAGLLPGRVVGLDSTQVDANASMDSLKHKTLHCTYEQYVLALRQQYQADATAEDAKRADRRRAGKASNAIWESSTDPEARVGQHAGGHTHLSYRVDVTVDLERGVITNAGAELSDQPTFVPRAGGQLRAVALFGGHTVEKSVYVPRSEGPDLLHGLPLDKLAERLGTRDGRRTTVGLVARSGHATVSQPEAESDERPADGSASNTFVSGIRQVSGMPTVSEATHQGF